LAQKGLTGPKSVFEGRDGFLNAYAGKGSWQIERLTDGFGQRWETVNIFSRPYPVCNISSPFMDAALILKKKHSIDLEKIKEVRCFVAPGYSLNIICEPWEKKVDPPTPYGAKYSMPYDLALMMVNERIDIEDFTPERFRPPRVMDLVKKVTYEADESRTKETGKVKITMMDGTVYQHEVLHKKGSHGNPITDEEVMEKFRRNVQAVLSEETLSRVVALVNGLENLENIKELTRILLLKT
ncbi:MmgE/PrpD family protein, partial [Thermodesulfobacteriota bacterium]